MKHKDEGRFDQAWGGIASLGLSLSIIYTAILERNFNTDTALIRIAEWLAAAPARLAGLHTKGAIRPDADADFAIFDSDPLWTVTESGLYFRHKISPYLGANLRGRILETWLRGERIYNYNSGSPAWSPIPLGKEWTTQ
jgi:allantoinase